MKVKKPTINRGLGLTPLALTLGACGSDSRNSPVVSIPDDGVTTVVVLDFFTNTNHGENVAAIVETITDVVVVRDDRSDTLLSSATPGLLIEAYSSNEAEVINTSFVVGNAPVQTSISYNEYSSAVGDLYASGVFVVAAAGNNGSFGASPFQVSSDLNIVVGALDASGDIAFYSNYHPTAVDFYADGSYGTGLGTSYASPRVAAYIAELIEANPDYTMSEIRTLLELNSDYVLQEHGGYKFVIQTIDGIDITEHVINSRVIVEAGFELFENINPEQAILDEWISKIDAGVNDYIDLKQYFDDTDFTGYTYGVAAVELAQAQYHWYEHRESTDAEVTAYLDSMDKPTVIAVALDTSVIALGNFDQII